MLKQSPDRVLAALASLEADAEFQVVVQWLEENLDQLRNDSAQIKDEVVLRWTQGAMQTLTELLGRAGSARHLQYAKRKGP